MKIRFYAKDTRSGMVSDDHELNLGRYNEFYLPSLDRDKEAWIIVTDDDGDETKLHLKR